LTVQILKIARFRLEFNEKGIIFVDAD